MTCSRVWGWGARDEGSGFMVSVQDFEVYESGRSRSRFRVGSI